MVIHLKSSLPLPGKQEGLIVYTNPVFPRIGIAPGLVLSLALLGCATPHPIALGPGRVEAEGRRVMVERNGIRVTVAFEGFLYFPRLDPEVARFSLLLSPVGAEELSFDFAMGK